MFSKIILVVIGSLYSFGSLAQTADTSDNYDPLARLRVSGYVYQGYQKSTNNNYIGMSSSPLGSLENRELGVTADYNLANNVDIRLSAKIEQHGTEVVTSPEFNYFLIDAAANINDTKIGLRVGKVRNIIGFYNATMENPVLRETDVAPQSIYREAWKHILISGLGYQVYTKITGLPYLDFDIDYSISEPVFSPKEDVLAGWFAATPTGYFDVNGSKLASVSVTAMTKDLSWVFRYDRYLLKAMYVSGINDFVQTGDYGVNISVVGLRHYIKDFTITYEYALIDPIADGWDTTALPGTLSSSYNLVVKYKATSKLSYYLGHNRWYTNITDPNGEYASKVTGFSPEAFFYRDTNISLKYIATRNWILKGSYHHITGAAVINNNDVNPQLLYNAAPTDRRMTLSVTYAF